MIRPAIHSIRFRGIRAAALPLLGVLFTMTQATSALAASEMETRFAKALTVARALDSGVNVAEIRVRGVGPLTLEPGVAPEDAVRMRPLDLEVVTWLHQSDSPPPEAPRVSWCGVPERTKTSIGPWTAWQGIEPQSGATLGIGLWSAKAPRPTWRGRPADLAFAVAGPVQVERLRQIVSMHRQDLVAQRALFERFAAGQVEATPEDMGYLLGCAIRQLAFEQPDAAAVLSLRLWERPATPLPARREIASWLTQSYYRLGAPVQTQVVSSLVGRALDAEDPVSLAALEAIARLVESEQVVLGETLAKDALRSLAERYRVLFTGERPLPSRLKTQLKLNP